jgi:hypothetical protein
MNYRIASVMAGVKNIASACSPVMRKFIVSYFNDEHHWTSQEVMAYSDFDAASRVKLGLKPGLNCFVRRVIGG